MTHIMSLLVCGCFTAGPGALKELGCNVELNVEFGPSDAGGFGTTSNAERESSRPPTIS